MGVIAILNSKAGYAGILFALSVLSLLGYELWQDLREYLDDYWVDKLRRSSPKHLNREAIKKIQESVNGREHFRFAVIGDTQKSFVSFNKILKRTHEDNFDFIIHLGDFTSSGRYTQYTKMVHFIEHIKVPIVLGVGNHDISNRGRECFAHFFGPLNFYFDTGPCRFIFVNNNEKEFVPGLVELPVSTHRYHLLRGLYDEQINYLELSIQEKEHNFVFMHIPPDFDQLKHHSFARNSDRFIKLMGKYSARIARVLCGHIHGYVELLSEGVPYIITGGAGERLHSRRDGITNRFNYVLVDVTKGEITHTVRFID